MLVEAGSHVAWVHGALRSPAVLLVGVAEDAEQVPVLILCYRLASHALGLAGREVSVVVGSAARPARRRERVMLYGEALLRQVDIPTPGSVVGVPQGTVHYDRLQREQTAVPAVGVPLLGVRYEPVAGV